MYDHITVYGARLHNLKNLTVRFPKNQLIVLTGLSGSGKSSLAFETLHKEGTRQFLESLGLVAAGLSRPPFERITGLSPSISVDQHLTNRSARSTVGTASDVYTYLRVLFAQVGHRMCLACGSDIPPEYDVGAQTEDDAGMESSYPCPTCGQPVPNLGMAHFSFNKPEGA